MDYEIQSEVDYIIEQVANFQFSRESGANKVRQAIKSIGRGADRKALMEALNYYENQCDRKGL